MSLIVAPIFTESAKSIAYIYAFNHLQYLTISELWNAFEQYNANCWKYVSDTYITETETEQRSG